MSARLGWRVATVVLVASGVLGATPASGSSARRFQGHYRWGFENSWFHPCDAPGERWWVVPGDRARAERDSLFATLSADSARDDGAVLVEVEGEVSDLTLAAGHLGRGRRYLAISRVYAMVSERHACPSATGSGG